MSEDNEITTNQSELTKREKLEVLTLQVEEALRDPRAAKLRRPDRNAIEEALAHAMESLEIADATTDDYDRAYRQLYRVSSKTFPSLYR